MSKENLKRTKAEADSSDPSFYQEEHIRSLDWHEHIRLRPGMYIGKLGDGSAPDDGIYVLLKEIIDNCIDEFVMGFGKNIRVVIEDKTVIVRDLGRGIPLGKVVDCVSKINTGGKYDSKVFKKSIGLNGVGTKAVNALSERFTVRAFRDGQVKSANFERGILVKESPVGKTQEPDGTEILFVPDASIFKNYRFVKEHVHELLKNYAFLNSGLTLQLGTEKFYSRDGLLDLLNHHVDAEDIRYPVIHLKGEDIEIALTHGSQYGETHYSFVNGGHTTMGGSHLAALREGVVKAVREHYKKEFDPSDIRSGLIAAISLKVQEPIFESQTKTKLGSLTMSPEGESIRSYIVDFLKTELDNFLHRHTLVKEELQKKILQSERERKEIAGIKKIAQERAKKANIFNKKLRDCRLHLSPNDEKTLETMLFITEGDSASGSLTQSRNVQTQAIFSIRGKPLNCYGLTKKVVYENEEFNLLQHALNIEDSIENLRYNKIVLATDADVDGMHIRLLLITFFLQFFPELVRNQHVFILETPLFRVRNKLKTIYCYKEEDKVKAVHEIKKMSKGDAEITRFKGLGEISPDEFGQFIGANINLTPVLLHQRQSIKDMLHFYMGKNTPERQDFIIKNLRTDLA
ncbi:MAG: type IIA DNA topoisomerase subunit B [Oligoflexales bacterium]|nr:type IIA DNA topoisomerase subunit B [Oligoflexales bacterium]